MTIMTIFAFMVFFVRNFVVLREIYTREQAVEMLGDSKVNVIIKEKSQGEEQEEVPREEKQENSTGVMKRPGKGNIVPMEKVLKKMFASKSIPRQKPKSGRFWKGERTQFRQIKRGRGKRHRGDQQPSFEQRLKMKEEKLRKRTEEN